MPLFSGGFPTIASALALSNVYVACCRACENCSANWAFCFSHHAGSFALVSKQIAECRELAAVAAVVPALRPWTRVCLAR